MGHYKSNLRDIEFALFEVFGRDKILGEGPYAEMDPATAREVLAEVDRLAREDLADSMVSSDRNRPVFDPATHQVTLPAELSQAWHTFWDAGWWRLDVPVELGGTPCPPSLRWAVSELVLGANPAVHMYTSGSSFANVLYRIGTEEQRDIARFMVERTWGATMVLTEPDAGSDVGAGRTRAIPQPDGTWHIDGVKRFITSAEHDLTENILHFVLARPEGSGPGTKGLSMFLVPKYHFDPTTGEPGERNGVVVTNVEHKMGLKGSTTCELSFGETAPAVGWLVGDVHDGIRQMFHIIEFARMMVGTKAIATLSTGYLNALEYAKTRVQGPDLARQADKASPRVTITHHPEVRRLLLASKAYAEGLRALVLYTATVQDEVAIAEATGTDASMARRLNDLLLPLVKGVGSERSYALLADMLTVYGGSGYLMDYPLEQYIRDAKIDTLYEGTTAIQGLDFFFRKIVRDQFGALGTLAGEISRFVQAEDGSLTRERELLGVALGEAQAMVATMVGFAQASVARPEEAYKVGQNTTRLLMAAGDVVIGWLLLREAEVALEALSSATGTDRDFYTGKVAAARFFAHQVLPRLTAERTMLDDTDEALMEVPEAAF